MRILNRFLAAAVALAVLAAAVILATEVIAVAAGARPVIYNWHPILRWAQRNDWDATSVRFTGAILAAAGLGILFVQLWPRRPHRLAVLPAGVAGTTDAGLTRRGIRTAVSVTANDLDGVSSTRITLRRRRLRVRIAAATGDAAVAAPLAHAVQEAIGRQLDELEMARPLRVSVRAKPTRKAA